MRLVISSICVALMLGAVSFVSQAQGCGGPCPTPSPTVVPSPPDTKDDDQGRGDGPTGAPEVPKQFGVGIGGGSGQ